MRIVLNGEQRELPQGATAADAVDATGADSPAGIAVAVEGEVIPRGGWRDYELADGQRVEVLQAVQGG